MPSRELTIVNKLGLHARAAARFVTVAGAFQSDIRVQRGTRSANGKSIMGVMMLAANKGSVITVSAEGDDAERALDALAALIADRFGEGE